MTHCDHRLLVELNGLKVHVYNRTNLYSKLEQFFGLESLLLPEQNKDKSEDHLVDRTSDHNDMTFWTSWRDLIPVIKVDLNMVSSQCTSLLCFIMFSDSPYIYFFKIIECRIYFNYFLCACQCRLAFGNRLVSSTLVVTADRSEGYYSTKAAAWSMDHFTHTFNATIENLRVRH